MAEAPFDGTAVLISQDGFVSIAKFSIHEDGVWLGRDDAFRFERTINGWWPLPDLTPMPAEFDGWNA